MEHEGAVACMREQREGASGSSEGADRLVGRKRASKGVMSESVKGYVSA